MRQAQNLGDSETVATQGKLKMGRPTEKNQERIQAVIEGLSKGKPLTHICAEIGVCDDTVRNWADNDEQLFRDIARARDRGFDAIALEALSIADDRKNDTILDDDGHELCNKEWIARAKLRVETRLKLLAKWDPKRYGDKPEVVINNNNTNATQNVVNLSPDQEASLQTLIQQTRDKVKK